MSKVRTIEIPLTHGKVAVVDVDDLHLLVPNKWCYAKKVCGYGLALCTRDQKHLHMHRLIAGAAPGQAVDHINGNPLDNRRCNLRLCSSSENGSNLEKHRDNKSGFKGVHWWKTKKMWTARVMKDGKTRCTYHHTIEEAVASRDKLARELHGEFFVPAAGRP